MNYYNEIDPYCAAWLQNLMDAGHIPVGHIDTRSIEDVIPNDLRGYDQCHFFAGIGGWPLALRLAGWPDSRPVWTGSCPCQPFSVAGKGNGAADKRHLWPAWFHLINQCRPPIVLGEQVAAAIGHAWLDGVCADMEGQMYAIGATVLPACAAGAPHRRDRLWFVADTDSQRSATGVPGPESRQEGNARIVDHGCHQGDVADAHGERSRIESEALPARQSQSGGGGNSSTLANANSISGQIDPHTRGGAQGSGAREVAGSVRAGSGAMAHADQPRISEGREQRSWEQRGPCRDPWARYGWIIGHDGKARRAEPSIRLLAHGIPGRVGRLRAYGNAIVPQVAAEFIAAYAEARGLILPELEAAA